MIRAQFIAVAAAAGLVILGGCSAGKIGTVAGTEGHHGTQPTAASTTTTTAPPSGCQTASVVACPGTPATFGTAVVLSAFTIQLSSDYGEFGAPDPSAASERVVAIRLVVKATGGQTIDEDVNDDVMAFDSAGQGFAPDPAVAQASGLGFPQGEIDVAPGATQSGWVYIQAPAADAITTMVFTAATSYADPPINTATWSIPPPASAT